MGQKEVFEILKKHKGEWFNTIEISSMLKEKVSIHVGMHLNKLYRFGFIKKSEALKYYPTGRKMMCPIYTYDGKTTKTK